MKQIFLHYHPRSVTMQPVHACVLVLFYCILMLLLLLCRYIQKKIGVLIFLYRYLFFATSSGISAVDMGSMLDRCVFVFVYFDT